MAEKALTTEEMDQLTDLLAKHYGYSRSKTCYCVGRSCNNPGCSTWWRLILKSFSREDMRKALYTPFDSGFHIRRETMTTDTQYKKIQERELEWWANTKVDPRTPWWYYDRVFLPYLNKNVGVVADIGCGPVPYFCNHNVRYAEAYAIDPLIDKYAGIAKYNRYRGPREFMALFSTDELGDEALDCAFLLNTLDHAIDPDWLLNETVRILKPHGKLFLYVDIEKKPDAMHPHMITRNLLQLKLEKSFQTEFLQIGQSWKFTNPIFWYVGYRREHD